MDRTEYPSSSTRRPRRWFGYVPFELVLFALAGCAALERDVSPLPEPGDSETYTRIWQVSNPTGPESPVTSQPATRPAEPAAALTKPYRLNVENIIHLTFQMAPAVAANREAMLAAQYGLEEFRTNLSRFEPYVRGDGIISRFPKRRDSRGLSGETVAGLEKETFDGAILRVEGGGSASRIKYGEVGEDQSEIDSGGGGTVRGRVEVPFVGSRKRQSRNISAAYQESNARAEMISYLENYASYTSAALTYYQYALYYLGYLRAHERQRDMLQELLDDPRTREQDHQRIQSTLLTTEALNRQYRTTYDSYLLMLLEVIGIGPDDAYMLEEPPADAASRYMEQARTPEGRRQLLSDAYDNTPKFRVLTDAIRDAELKRSLVLRAKYDVTAYTQGTRFAFGSKTFDDRVGGWELTAGASLRINDPRVLNASLDKAAAEIRQYQNEIEALRLQIQNQIDTQSAILVSYEKSMGRVLENIETTRAVLAERWSDYLERGPHAWSIDNLLIAMGRATTAECQLFSVAYNVGLSDAVLMSTTGFVYKLVGLEIVNDGNGRAELIANDDNHQ
ncbi:MAG: hypothetical protein GXY44_06390 [Phycisphaerales bacterium]|nr:hypothetical protein [Phycisphaerales bacterium]